MLNTTTHRVTSLEDAEAWADAQVSRSNSIADVRVSGLPARTEAPFRGLTYQGRLGERAHPVEEAVTETKITDGAHAASYVGQEDDCEPATWWQDTLFMLACAAGTCALAFLGWLWRVQ